MPRQLYAVHVALVGAEFLPKPDEERRQDEPWLQPHCPLYRRGYEPCASDVIDPLLHARLFGGRVAGVGSERRAGLAA